MINPIEILEKYYDNKSVAYSFLLPHSNSVAELAVTIGQNYGNVDLDFIYNGAMLHDVGIFLTKAPSIGCNGDKPYIQHGVLGEEILKEAGLEKLAIVCRTHVGVALDAQYITEKCLPLHAINMVPLTVEEEIIAYADKFFSKRPESLTTAKPKEIVIKSIAKFGEGPLNTFLSWDKKYGNF